MTITGESIESIITKRRNKAIHERDKRWKEINDSFPDIADINYQLSSTSMQLLAAFRLPNAERLKISEEIRQNNLLLNERLKSLLVQHGYTENYLEIQHICHICEDSGFIDMNTECDCRKQLRFMMRQNSSGISARFLSRTFQNFNKATPERLSWYQTAKDYTVNFDSYCKDGTGLYIQGTNGTGKTHLACAIANKLISCGTAVICKTSKTLLDDIKSSWDGSNNDCEEAILADYRNVPLLIIDDLGKEQGTDWNISTLFAIINDRYENLKPTVITTNYSPQNLIKHFTQKNAHGDFDSGKVEALVSRLHEVSIVLTMAGQDYRQGNNGG